MPSHEVDGVRLPALDSLGLGPVIVSCLTGVVSLGVWLLVPERVEVALVGGSLTLGALFFVYVGVALARRELRTIPLPRGRAPGSDVNARGDRRAGGIVERIASALESSTARRRKRSGQRRSRSGSSRTSWSSCRAGRPCSMPDFGSCSPAKRDSQVRIGARRECTPLLGLSGLRPTPVISSNDSAGTWSAVSRAARPSTWNRVCRAQRAGETLQVSLPPAQGLDGAGCPRRGRRGRCHGSSVHGTVVGRESGTPAPGGEARGAGAAGGRCRPRLQQPAHGHPRTWRDRPDRRRGRRPLEGGPPRDRPSRDPGGRPHESTARLQPKT